MLNLDKKKKFKEFLDYKEIQFELKRVNRIQAMHNLILFLS